MVGQGGEETKFKRLGALIGTPPTGSREMGRGAMTKGNGKSPFERHAALVIVKKGNKDEMEEDETAKWIKTNMSETRRGHGDTETKWRAKVEARVNTLVRKTQKAQSCEVAKRMFA